MVEITPVDGNGDDIFFLESLVGPELLKKVRTPAVSTSKEAFSSTSGTTTTSSIKGNGGKKEGSVVGKKKKKNSSSSSTTTTPNNNPTLLVLYFSASWCPPCQRFTPLLTEFYKTAKKTSLSNEFEIVFVSSDRNNEEFEEYYGKMPWLAIPPVESSATIKQNLSNKLGVTAIPALAIVDGKTGEFIAGGTARDDVIRVTTTVTGSKNEVCDPDQVKAVLGKWKTTERHSMLEAPRLMDTGAGKRSFVGKLLSFVSRNPMIIFLLIYLYRWSQKQINENYGETEDDGVTVDEKSPSSIVDSGEDDTEF